MHTVVCSDRDGTINRDDNYYLGSDPAWRGQVEFLEGVIEGIKLIKTIPNSHLFIVTNQSGVALRGGVFDKLTEERVDEVNRYLLTELKNRGAQVDGYFACPFVDSEYVRRAKRKSRECNPDYVQDGHPDLKPNPGMLERALKSLDLSKEDCNIFMIGDRASDVEMGLRGGGTGILVESPKTIELEDRAKVESLDGKVYIAKNFLRAAEYIVKNS